MKVEITTWSVGIEREPEVCVFKIEDADPHCCLCGQQCSHSMKNWHPGPAITMSGWFETQECHDIDAEAWQDVELLYRGEHFDPGMPIVVAGCLPTGDGTYRYPLRGHTLVGMTKAEQGRAL